MPVPDVIKGYAVSIVSLFLGASVVHNIFKPDLVRIDSDCLFLCENVLTCYENFGSVQTLPIAIDEDSTLSEKEK
jgi:hypothetical protein